MNARGPIASLSHRQAAYICVGAGISLFVVFGKPLSQAGTFHTVEQTEMYEGRIVEFSTFFYGCSRRAFRRRAPNFGVDVVIAYTDANGTAREIFEDWPITMLEFHELGDSIPVFEFTAYENPASVYLHYQKLEYVLSKYPTRERQLLEASKAERIRFALASASAANRESARFRRAYAERRVDRSDWSKELAEWEAKYPNRVPLNVRIARGEVAR